VLNGITRCRIVQWVKIYQVKTVGNKIAQDLNEYYTYCNKNIWITNHKLHKTHTDK